MQKELESEHIYRNFQKVTGEEWRKKIEAGLKNLTFDSLEWKTREGINYQPFYTEEDTKARDIEIPRILPKKFIEEGQSANHWINHISVKVENVSETNQLARNLLNDGVEGITFEIPNDFSQQNMQQLCEEIYPEFCQLSWKSNQPEDVLNAYLKTLANRQIDPAAVNGFLQYDPLHIWLSSGKDPGEFKITNHDLGLAIYQIDASLYQNSGSNIVQEIAYSLNQLTERIDRLLQSGLSIDQIAQKLHFLYAAGINFNIEVAKFRVLPLLINRVLSSFGLADTLHPPIHVVSSSWFHTSIEHENNMIRNTIQGLSAAVGGCTSIELTPHTHDIEGLFIAKNISCLLREESYLDKVIDPAHGAYFIETLSVELAEKSWSLFQEIEKMGGFANAVSQNRIQKAIFENRDRQWKAVQNQEITLVGINKFNKHQLPPQDNEFKVANEEVNGKFLLKPMKLSEPIENFVYQKGGDHEA